MIALADAISRVRTAPLDPATRPPAITITPETPEPPSAVEPVALAGRCVTVSSLIGADAIVVRRLGGAGAVVEWMPAPDFGLDSGTAAVDAAAPVAEGRAFAAVVTDTEGSARLAAAQHGLAAFKPTLHTVPLDHWTTVSWTMDDLVPIAASVGDAVDVLGVLTGAGARGPAELDTDRVGGADLVADDDLELCLAAARVLSRAQAAQYHAELGTDLSGLPAPVRDELELAATITAAVYIRSLRLRHQLLERVTAVFEAVDVLELTTTPRTCALASLLNLPAVTLPSGTQLVGAPGHDARLLAFANPEMRI